MAKCSLSRETTRTRTSGTSSGFTLMELPVVIPERFATSNYRGHGGSFGNSFETPLLAAGSLQTSGVLGRDSACRIRDITWENAVSARRILVVDDNRDSATSLAMLLKLTGNDTRTAHDGMEAVEQAETYKPAVILLDIGLPKMNGYEACRRIRAQPGGDAIHMVALTGWGQEEDRRKSQEAGFDGHLLKPVDYATLAKLLSRLPSTSA